VNASECPICRHIERRRIDHAIFEGRPDAYFKNHFAADADSVQWHKANCLGVPVDDDPSAARGEIAATAAEHQQQLREMRETALRIAAEAAADQKQWRTALSAVNAVSRLVIQEAKLRDRKRPPAPRLADSAEWQQLKSRILAVLERFPDARRALMEALQDD
jgi:hypothetical protein